MNHSQSEELLARNRKVIPGGVVSLNRLTSPEIAFARARGAELWDVDGNRYIDYHAAFGPFLFGHGAPEIDSAVKKAMDDGLSLMGSGATAWEGEAAELLCRCVPSVEKVQFTNTGSEATYLALRLARSFTGRDHIVVMQGGYNGWHDEVACNVMTPLDLIGPYVECGEYPYLPLSAGIAPGVSEYVHVVNFNDLKSVRWVFETYPVAGLITEPILQNIGIVHPLPGYLAGLRALCDEFGVILIFDEVKTGFRHAIGGYQSICGVSPDLSVFGKAIANGYPVGAIGGGSAIMDLFTDPDTLRRVLIAGTYNGHPVPMAAAIASMKKLLTEGDEFYDRLESLGARMGAGLNEIVRRHGVTAVVSRQGSAFCLYFMDHTPVHWHDLASNHNMAFDLNYRRALIERGVYHFPLQTKQGSISSAHTTAHIDETLETTEKVFRELCR